MTRPPPNPKFMCVMAPKALVYDPTSDGMRRANTDSDVTKALHNVEVGESAETLMLMQGGGIGVRGATDNLYTHSEGTVIVAFVGELTNIKYLMMKSGMTDAEGWQTSKATEASPARVLFHLYTALGYSKTVAKLHGNFSFVLYDSAIARVFAARDPSGKLALFQGTFGNNMFVSNFEPENSTSHTEVPAGHLIAGGRRSCVPERFLPDEKELLILKASAQTAAKAAMTGIQGVRPRARTIKRFFNSAVQASCTKVEEEPLVVVEVDVEVALVDVETPPRVKGKTKRGVRGGAGRRRRSPMASTAEEMETDVVSVELVAAEPVPAVGMAAVTMPILDLVKAEQTIAALVRKFSSGNLQSLGEATQSGMTRVGSCSNMLKDEEEATGGIKRVPSLSHMALA